ncbi:hypothetical protein CC1G_02854 [Coprinopsis cinerea okayama7|uniref:Transmembrane protein n=1 Tax=Coprinopsis cinerea (strain Okayama-7 / 130 / ATCC MYA-4618 / FGSC 9003) TaxID=240176 RepID=A8N085_COPC7|nr:hypothetical protein CC1G_02854 [Coprinopsis cinerea okayama7\|eukprot:XP_001828273.1 hypothetical protein CC1G_02854 [Coprinopsis cinerea okayama7\
MAYSRAALILLALEVLSVSVAALRFETLHRREATTNATCSSDFEWAKTARGRTPCRAAADVMAPCNGGNWHIRDLPQGNFEYDTPKDQEATICSCSWSAYNLISACAACQGMPEKIKTWRDYSLNCPEPALTPDRYYPRDVLPPDDVTIPYWASVDPSTWQARMWNVREARSLYDQGRDDLNLALENQKKSKSSAGPIAGGVIGGLVVVFGAAALAFFLLKRHRKKIALAKGIVPPDFQQSHYRSPSDASAVSMSYTNLSSSPGPYAPTGHTPTVRTHETSAYPFSVFGTPDRVSGPSNTPASPTPAHTRQTSATSREDIITPFNLHAALTPSPPPGDRKMPLGSVPHYDSPNAPPARADDALFQTPPRGRINPPAYTPEDTSPSPPPVAHASGSRRVHGKSGSTDTHRTQTTTVSAQQRSWAVGHSAANSISDYTTSPPPIDARSGVPEGTTFSPTTESSYPRDVKRRPTDDDFNGRDLA